MKSVLNLQDVRYDTVGYGIQNQSIMWQDSGQASSAQKDLVEVGPSEKQGVMRAEQVHARRRTCGSR